MKKQIIKKFFILFGIMLLSGIIIIIVSFVLFPDNDLVINIAMGSWLYGLFGLTFIFVVPIGIKNLFTNSMFPQPIPKNEKKKQEAIQENQRKIIKYFNRFFIVFGIHSALCILMAIILIILRFTCFA